MGVADSDKNKTAPGHFYRYVAFLGLCPKSQIFWPCSVKHSIHTLAYYPIVSEGPRWAETPPTDFELTYYWQRKTWLEKFEAWDITPEKNANAPENAKRKSFVICTIP